MKRHHGDAPLSGVRLKIYDVIFEADTLAGRLFDLSLLMAIVLSILAVMLESVASLREQYGASLRVFEWVFTGLFTIEYILRIVAVRRPLRYIFSFFGLIDLCAILPSFLSLYFSGTQSLIVIRGIRLLRIFRIFKLGRYLGEAKELYTALSTSIPKITVFLGTILSVVLIMGAAMYLVEGEKNGFTSIPRSMYWAIVTMTTVGYGDIAPTTNLGQTLAAILMIIGYGVIAVPTGIVSAQLGQQKFRAVSNRVCDNCFNEEHDRDAQFCKQCGATLTP